MKIRVEKDTRFNARLMKMLATYYIWVDGSIIHSSDNEQDTMDKVEQIKKAYVEAPKIEVILEETI